MIYLRSQSLRDSTRLILGVSDSKPLGSLPHHDKGLDFFCDDPNPQHSHLTLAFLKNLLLKIGERLGTIKSVLSHF